MVGQAAATAAGDARAATLLLLNSPHTYCTASVAKHTPLIAALQLPVPVPAPHLPAPTGWTRTPFCCFLAGCSGCSSARKASLTNLNSFKQPLLLVSPECGPLLQGCCQCYPHRWKGLIPVISSVQDGGSATTSALRVGCSALRAQRLRGSYACAADFALMVTYSKPTLYAVHMQPCAALCMSAGLHCSLHAMCYFTLAGLLCSFGLVMSCGSGGTCVSLSIYLTAS